MMYNNAGKETFGEPTYRLDGPEDREQRKKNIEKALAINSLGGVEPSEEFTKLAEQYVDGELTAYEMNARLVKLYKKNK